MSTDDSQLQQVIQTLQQHNAVASQHSDIEKELQRVNREMYERNVELAIRNQTLSVLRKLYEIINTSLGVNETADKLITAIVTELKFQGGAIALIDADANVLKSTAVFRRDVDSSNTLVIDAITLLKQLSLSLTQADNFAVDCAVNRKVRMTNSIYDIVTPLVNQKKADELQQVLGVQTLVLYPIIFAGLNFGVLIIGLDKHVGDLSRAERELLHELIYVVGIAIDRAKLYSDLKEANEKLKALDKLKDDFVSVASHELRTPMTAIKSYLWMALSGKGGELSEKQKYYLDRSYSSTDRLIKLVNDMLNISRIESGRMTYDMQKVDMTALANDVITDVKPRADELGIKIEVRVEGDGLSVEAVLADADKIKEVLFNIVGNSLKFTPKDGTITINLSRKNTMIQCDVTDTGAGLGPEDLAKLFQKFGLLPGSYTINKTDQQGTGLGLFITKSIIEKHGGEITASSEGLGKGATFTFTLPVFDQQKFEEFHKGQEGKEKIGMIHTAVV